MYIYADDAAPLLPKGTILHFVSWWDNTANNAPTPIPINGSDGAIAPSTKWATRGSTSRTSRTTSSRPKSPGARRPRRRRPRRGSADTCDLRVPRGFVMKLFRPCASAILLLASAGMLASARPLGAGQAAQGVGQVPSPLPLSNVSRERGSSVTPAYEGWYHDRDGSVRFLVGYYNRNTKQEFDIPAGPDNRIEPGEPDQGQPTHFDTGRQWGVFTLKVPPISVPRR